MIIRGLVEVIDAKETPLSPCKPSKARKLLERGMATIFSYRPFTIQLVWVVENPQFTEKEHQNANRELRRLVL